MAELEKYRKAVERSGLLIRALTEEDCSELVRTSRETFADTFGQSTTKENVDAYMNEAYDPAQLASELRDPHCLFFFAYGSEHCQSRDDEGAQSDQPPWLHEDRRRLIPK